jgi:hypothetical protein
MATSSDRSETSLFGGYIHCRVTVPIDICDHCNASYSLEGIDKILDHAFQREYDKR